MAWGSLMHASHGVPVVVIAMTSLAVLGAHEGSGVARAGAASCGAPSGSDGDSGTEALSWRTVQKPRNPHGRGRRPREGGTCTELVAVQSVTLFGADIHAGP